MSTLEGELCKVTAVPVGHGMLPSVAYRVEHEGRSIVFSGDVERDEPGLIDLAHGCDLLVHHLALPEREVEHGHLHAKPSQVGRVAAAAGCRTLLVSHIMPELEEALDLVRDHYHCPIVVAHDLLTITP
jgi:ribonuclease BN (tRNA processing enzyme)